MLALLRLPLVWHLRVFSSVISADVAFRLVWLRHLLSGAEKRAATLEAYTRSAATHYHFIREIPMVSRYEVRASIGAWDDNWTSATPLLTPITPFTPGAGTPSLGTGGGGAPEPDEVAKALLARGARQLEPDGSLLYMTIRALCVGCALCAGLCVVRARTELRLGSSSLRYARPSMRYVAPRVGLRCARRPASAPLAVLTPRSWRAFLCAFCTVVRTWREAYVPGPLSAAHNLRLSALARGSRADARSCGQRPELELARVPALCVILVRYARPRGPLSAPFVVRDSRAAELRAPAGRAIQCGFSLRGEQSWITDRERLRSNTHAARADADRQGRTPPLPPYILARHTPQVHLHAGAAPILRRRLAH
ncbi:hypothetical protein FB451DRAFT_1400683 [Mycena latifolia]|nr:hypothetical protein FB451DRAFT_1400683 [Mycena latifolia]